MYRTHASECVADEGGDVGVLYCDVGAGEAMTETSVADAVGIVVASNSVAIYMADTHATLPDDSST